MISELPNEEGEHGGYCSLIRYEVSFTGLGNKLCRETSISDLPDDMNWGPAKHKAGFVSTTLKYCGVAKGLIGTEIRYLRLFTLLPH